MHKKIKLLIIVSILGILALSLIQGYLVNNTYKLEKTAFISETRRSISRMDDLSPSLDTINDLWQDKFLNLVADYYSKQIPKEKVLTEIKSFTDSINDLYITNYQKELKKKEIDYDLKFNKIVNTIIVADSIGNRRDTIFNSKPKKGFHLLGDKFTIENGHKVSNSMWLTDHSFDREIEGKSKSFTYSLQFETEDRMNIDGWKRIVLWRMSSLLLTSILIFLLVFGLLYYSIKNLITQKKIADIKTDFVNNITHELKTPLATLTLATKMLKSDNDVSLSKVANTTVNTIERQNIRLQKLIDQVLNNSLGYQEIQLKKEEVNSTKYINTVLDDFLLSLDGEKVEIVRDLKDNSKILIDKFYFTTALFNLLENAVKYSESKTIINVFTSCKNSFVVSIKDNGIGISIKDQKQLFDKFYRVGNKEVHNVKGLGLGLYYTNQIIKAHNGKININSVEGKGATFTIEIPIK